MDPRRRRFADLVVEADARPSVRPRALAWVLFLGAAAAVGFALTLQMPAETPVQPLSGETRRPYAVKGGVSVKLALQRGGQVQPYAPGDPALVGDRFRVSIDDPLGGYATVLYEDERAVDVLYRPEEFGRLPPGRHLLPGSLELDDVIGRERIYVLISPEAPIIDDWLAEIDSARRDAGFDHGWLPRAPTRITTIDYRKVSR